MIDFELSPDIAATYDQLHMLAEHAMRPIAREYDERALGQQPAAQRRAGKP